MNWHLTIIAGSVLAVGGLGLWGWHGWTPVAPPVPSPPAKRFEIPRGPPLLPPPSKPALKPPWQMIAIRDGKPAEPVRWYQTQEWCENWKPKVMQTDRAVQQNMRSRGQLAPHMKWPERYECVYRPGERETWGLACPTDPCLDQ